MERMSGGSQTHSGGGQADSQIHLRAGGASDGGGSAHLRDRLLELGSGARDSLRNGTETLSRMVGQGTDLVASARNHPLAAVGLVFSVGFLTAVVTGGRTRPKAVERIRTQLRAVLLAGVTAAVAQELRSLMGEEDLSELIGEWTGDEDDDEEQL